MLHRYAAPDRKPGRGRPNWKLIALPSVVAIAAGTLGLVVLPSQAATAPPAGKAYRLVVEKSGMCIDVPKASTASGTPLQQWGCSENSPWQQFTLTAVGGGRYHLVNVNSGKCIDVPHGARTSGLQVQQWSCSDTQTNQQWTLTPSRGGTFQIFSVATGLCLSDKGASLASGNPVIQETCTNNSNKRWTFTPVTTPMATATATSRALSSPTPRATATSPSAGAKPTVAADGTGTYRTVQAAVDAVPARNTRPVTITIKAGTYREHVVIPSDKPRIAFKGTGSSPRDVVIVANGNAVDDGTIAASTVVVQAPEFTASNLTISNDWDNSIHPSQAQALYLDSDRSRLDDVRLLGNQDTFLVNNSARVYVTNSYIEGTVDFIYGGGIAVFDHCAIHEKRTTGGPITAASTPSARKYGFLFYRSTITGATGGTVQLGRPWRQDAQVLYRESNLSSALATSQPWIDMGAAGWRNARFLEYRNTGAGATVNSHRPQLPASQAADYTPQKYLAGSDGWDPTVTATTTTSTTTTPAAATHPWSDTPDGFASTGGGTTGGAAGTTVTVTTYPDLLKYATATAPYVIRIATAITVPDYGYEIPVTSNKTLIGVGTRGAIVHGGIFLAQGTHNVIIRNLTIGQTRMADDPNGKIYDYDGIQMDTADHVWIDHNTISSVNDGLIDSRKDTSYLTVSWNVLADDNKAFGIGWTSNVKARITIHHNWIHDTNQRNPSVDNVALAHLYDNYMQNITSYGNLSRGSSKTVIENTYYENVKNPYYPDTSAASLSQSGSILVSCTGREQTNGTTFDPRAYYSYTLHPAKVVPALVTAYAGPQVGIGN